MGRWRGMPALAAALAGAVVAGCGPSSRVVVTSLPTQPPGATPSVASPAGAMAGFIGAAAAQDNDKAASWLATSSDTTDLTELLNVYANFGSGGQSGLYWEVAGLRVIHTTTIDSTHADVTLNGNVVWCLGKSADDPAATCAAVNGVAGMAHTYLAVAAGDTWKVDIDINASSELDNNPQAPTTTHSQPASPASPLVTASPSPT